MDLETLLMAAAPAAATAARGEDKQADDDDGYDEDHGSQRGAYPSDAASAYSLITLTYSVLVLSTL